MGREYIIYADESIKEGRYFSNFYGAAIVRSRHLRTVNRRLRKVAESLGLRRENKWEKVTSQYRDRYIGLMEAFFGLVKRNRVKVRIMFTQNRFVPDGLTGEQKENAYFLLYYQFIKHGLGLRYAGRSSGVTRCRLYLDRLPDTREKAEAFKGYVCGLSKSAQFRHAGLRIMRDQIAEVDSKDHIILQCLDIVLGAMQFRLNDKHKEKPKGASRRGKRTIAKEALHRFINRQIREIYPNFNVGISTGIRGDETNRWRDPYRHWLFVPNEHVRDDSRTKP